ncbi:MAG: 4Fe-4S binding protein [Piscinibacter sp.]|uniref:4Fe-4S binding protein n=1 Tax=Piscinibacter sp. TaxID=1903157 RepID=UPI00258CE59F|nr:4Fe-4S binding protein [Piscinibacter sp.]MCW5664738.1 4Fe-4S binding protein [Piscinibacter sp.]
MDAEPAPAFVALAATHAGSDTLQRRRRLAQAAFFALFLLAPAFDLLRFDLTEAQLWFLGQRWSLGIDAFRAGQIGASEAALNILWRGFLPAIVLIVVFLGVAYRWGRLYCGWLCPHFSSVELLNDLLHRAIGKLSLWDRTRTPRAGRTPQRRWWPVFGLSCLLLGFAWAITALTYLLPPAVIWGNLVHGTLTANQARFIAIGTAVFTLEFAFARHLFCRFGCAVGLFQSLAWMANPKGMVVAFARERARDCRTCEPPEGSACDHACPMRLHPRNIKRMMFSCVQCGQCLQACEHSQTTQQREPLLQWAVGADAVRETLRQRRAELDAARRD